jgi:hypothetical protein
VLYIALAFILLALTFFAFRRGHEVRPQALPMHQQQ